MNHDDNLPDWLENGLHRLREASDGLDANNWKRVAILGELLDPALLPRRSQLWRDTMPLLCSMGKVKKRSLIDYYRVWTTLKANGEVWIPANLHYSAVFEMVKGDAGIDILRTADSEGWTLVEARAWRMGQRVQREVTAKLAAAIRQAIPRPLRNRVMDEGLTSAEAFEIRQAVAEALSTWVNDG